MRGNVTCNRYPARAIRASSCTKPLLEIVRLRVGDSRMTGDTVTHRAGQVLSVFDRVGAGRGDCRDRRSIGGGQCEVELRRRHCIFHRRQTSKVCDDCMHVLVSNVPVHGEGHGRADYASVGSDSFPYCSNDLAVGPLADARLSVRREIGAVHSGLRHRYTRSAGEPHVSAVIALSISRRMTVSTRRYAVDKDLSSFNERRLLRVSGVYHVKEADRRVEKDIESQLCHLGPLLDSAHAANGTSRKRDDSDSKCLLLAGQFERLAGFSEFSTALPI